MSILRHPIKSIFSNALRGVLTSLPFDWSDTMPGPGGSFSNAFSAAFDLVFARNSFSNAYSSAFARFDRQKEFSSDFSDAFTNSNI